MVVLLALVGAGLSSCQKELRFDEEPAKPDHNLIIHFKPVVDTLALGLDTGHYKNIFDEPYTVSQFKFYISNIELINTDSAKTVSVDKNGYYLIDARDSVSQKLQLKLYPYKYNRISFTIGVDSVRNVSGAQTGALDPAKGMFWTWTTGYIFAKLEGNSSASSQPNGKFEYHIGGFTTPNSAIRKVTLLFPYTQALDMAPGKTSTMNITANVNAWFNNPHDLQISVNPVAMSPGELAKDVSENYSKMFTVTEVVNE